jgi:outer membrane protein assembly factor BamD (BamD/ComL family)
MSQESTKFERYIEQAIVWIRGHQERFWTIVGVAVLTVLFGFFAIQQHQRQLDDAWAQLGNVQGALMQNRPDVATTNLKDWEKKYGSSGAATYAKFLKADLLSKTSDYASAAQVYAELARTAHPSVMQPLALSAEISEEESAGKIPQARATAQKFIELYPDHFFAASAYMSQARLAEMSGDKVEASRLYERFVVLYPQSPWTASVRNHLQMITPAKTASPSIPELGR